jgi:hypothetical protein
MYTYNNKYTSYAEKYKRCRKIEILEFRIHFSTD